MPRNETAVRALADISRLLSAAMDLAQIGDDEGLRHHLDRIHDKLNELYGPLYEPASKGAALKPPP